MKGILRLTIFAAILTFCVTGCKKGGGQASRSKTFSQQITINITSEPQTLDPRKARALTDINLIRMFMDGLTRTDQGGKPSLALAKKVEISEDKKTYTFTLRDAKWSNGDPVTSHDFAYSWKKSLSPDFNSPNASMLYPIQNAREAKQGQLPLSLVGIEAPDAKTLIVSLKHPTPYFLDLISHPIFFPVNEIVDRQNPHWAENQSSFVGNGPFSVGDWKHSNILLAEKNKHYWDQKSVSLSALKMVMVSEETGFKMFDTSELNWDGSPFSTIPVDAIQTLKEAKALQSAPVLATQWIRVNVNHPLLKSKKIRKALGLAIDRRLIIDHVTQGNQIPATGIVPQAMGLTDIPYFTDGDVKAARELFNEAMNEIGLSPQQLTGIPLLFASAERNYLIAQAIQDQWHSAFGFLVQLEPVESKVYFDRISKKDYALSIGNWFADFNDPINFLEVFKSKECGTNNTNWESPSYQELLETSYQCESEAERKAILQRSEEILINDMPVIPIFHYSMLYLQDSQLKDVVLTTMGNIDFKWAHVEGD